jgi:hypothetical protein
VISGSQLNYATMENRAKDYITALHAKSKDTYLAETWYCIAVRIISMRFDLSARIGDQSR